MVEASFFNPEHAASHTKPLCVPTEKAVRNVKTNKLIPNKKGVKRTEQALNSTPKDQQTMTTLKHNKKRKMVHIDHIFDPKILLFDPCKGSLGTWEKDSA